MPLREGPCQRYPSYNGSPVLNIHTRLLTSHLCLHVSLCSCSLQPLSKRLPTWLCPNVSFTTSATLGTAPLPWTRVLLARGPISEDGGNVGCSPWVVPLLPDSPQYLSLISVESTSWITHPATSCHLHSHPFWCKLPPSVAAKTS